MAGGARWAAAALVGVLGAGVTGATAGCGHDPDRTRPADEWARAVCPALLAWRAGVSAEDQSNDPRDVLYPMAADQAIPVREAQYEETARTGLLLRMAHSHRLTEQALAAVRSAGLPEVDNRRQIRDRLIAALSGLVDWYGQVERALVDVRTGDPTAYAADLEAIAMINPKDGVTPAGLLVWLDAQPQLTAAFARVEECRPATGAS